MMKKISYLLIFSILISLSANSQPWVPDLNNGKFKNPIIYADYSDVDIIRSGDDFFMIASSFNCTPGIPILQSKDLVNWTIVNYVYQNLPLERYNKPVHGEGSWAPSITYHNHKFYIYFCTPHDGLFLATTDDPRHEWKLQLIEAVDLWEDPCPVWDDNGNTYMIHSKLCGNELYLNKLSEDGTQLLDNGTLIYKDAKQPTIEGPKFLKKDGYYYILAPAGGVTKGWQTVLRSKNIYGPYESKIVLHTGNTNVNGPHQGGLVELKSGEWWFVHFQSKSAYGRIIHLQPVKWENGWPMMGVDTNGDEVGEPVAEFIKPNVGNQYPIQNPQTSDEFNDSKLGLQWQWHANQQKEWYSFRDNPGQLRLFAVKNYSQNGNFWIVPNLLMQKFPAPAFSATTKVTFMGDRTGEKCGLTIMGVSWAYLALSKTETGIQIGSFEGKYMQCEDKTEQTEASLLNTNTCYLRVMVNDSSICHFSYSLDNKNFINIGKDFKAEAGKWIGAKVGLFCINPNVSESKGYADFDWFKLE
jgi:beta-xylosidase